VRIAYDRAGQAERPEPEAGSSTVASITSPKHRGLAAATFIYLTLPAILFAYGWLRWPYAILNLSLLVSSIVVACADMVRGMRAGLSLRSVRGRLRSLWWIAPAGALIACWLLLSGAGGFGFQNPDYQASNALLKDLIQQDWPVTMVLDGVERNVVYYVGYYLVAAGVGKALGWAAANVAIFVWTGIGALLAFAWFRALCRVNLGRKPGRLVWVTLMFCLAGGLDTLAVLAREGRLPDLTVHLEPWAGPFQYSSNTTLLYWVPQHSLAAWLMTGMVVTSVYAPQGLRWLGISLAVGILWSPFGVIGVAPYLILLLLLLPAAQWRKLVMGRSTLLFNLAVVWVAAIHILYLASNRYEFPMGFVWQSAEDSHRLVWLLVAFWLVEFALLAAVTASLLAVGSRSSGGRGAQSWQRLRLVSIQEKFKVEPLQLSLFVVSLIILFALPLLKVGYLNDLVMRASIPSLFVLQAFVAKVLLDANIYDARPRVRLRLGLLYILLVSVVSLSFLPALAEVSRSARFYQLGAPAFSEVRGSADSNPRLMVERRVGGEDSLCCRYLGR
jgi:hypothetical protein